MPLETVIDAGPPAWTAKDAKESFHVSVFVSLVTVFVADPKAIPEEGRTVEEPPEAGAQYGGPAVPEEVKTEVPETGVTPEMTLLEPVTE